MNCLGMFGLIKTHLTFVDKVAQDSETPSDPNFQLKLEFTFFLQWPFSTCYYDTYIVQVQAFVHS